MRPALSWRQTSDKVQWREDAGAFLETCRDMHLPAALERLRSGNGGHVWLFFDQPIPAGLARRLGAHILTETMERRPDIGLDSYDRFFPNQGHVNLKAGSGISSRYRCRSSRASAATASFSMISLHLMLTSGSFSRLFEGSVDPKPKTSSATPRPRGGSSVVSLALIDEDDDEPWTVPPSRRRKEPPITGPLPQTLELVFGNEIYIAKEGLPPGLRNRLLRLAAFQNPEFYKAQAMRLPTYDKPRIIACAEDHPQHVGLPRGCLDDLARTALRLGHGVCHS